MNDYKILIGNCLDRMKEIPNNSIDAIVTDPPYHLTSITKRFGKKNSSPAKYGTDGIFVRDSKGFMGKTWDGGDISYNIDLWKECLRILKPGAYLISFGGTRTYHRMVCAIEDAGFEIRDMINWVYGSGFPKSRNIGKTYTTKTNKINEYYNKLGTSLKPAHEPIVLARKPISEKTLLDNIIKWGVGGINIEKSRIPIKTKQDLKGYDYNRRDLSERSVLNREDNWKKTETPELPTGHFPSNLVWSHHPDCIKTNEWDLNTNQKDEDNMNNPNCYIKKWVCVEGCPSKEFEKAGNCGAFAPVKIGQKGFGGTIYGKYNTSGDDGKSYYKDGLGSPSRFFKNLNYNDEELLVGSSFFYCPKASKSERNKGLTNLETKVDKIVHNRRCKTCGKQEVSGSPCKCPNPNWEIISKQRTHKNFHPTVKPLKLMNYLINLISKENDVILDPFMGSGSTGVSCMKTNRKFIGIELTEEYIPIAEGRIRNAIPKQKKL